MGGIIIFEVLGHLLISTEISDQNFLFDISTLACGAYVIQLGSDVQRIIVE